MLISEKLSVGGYLHTMTDKDASMLKINEAYLGPTLLNARALLEKMDIVPLCAVCPAAKWYQIANDRLNCYCSQFHGVMYNDPKKAVTLCDGRADAIVK